MKILKIYLFVHDCKMKFKFFMKLNIFLQDCESLEYL